MSSSALRRTAVLAMLTAVAYAAVLICKLIFPFQIEGFLSLEIKDSILAIAGFLYGPAAGLLTAAVTAAVECVTVSTTGWIGLIMNVLSSALFVCPAAFVYQRRRTLQGALIGLITGTLCTAAGMVLWNYLITPLYMGVPRGVVAAMLLPTILPFNLLKAGINAAIALLLYKSVVRALNKARLLPRQETAGSVRWGVIIPALLLLAALIVTALLWAGVL